MVDSECPMLKIVACNLRKAGAPLSICIHFIHLKDKGLSLETRTARQFKSGFSITFYWEQCKTGTEEADSLKKKKEKKSKMASRRKNREHKMVLHIDSTEALSLCLVYQIVHTSTWSPNSSPLKENIHVVSKSQGSMKL